jgi:hypothetical protein
MSRRMLIVAGIALIGFAAYSSILHFGPNSDVGVNAVRSSFQTQTPSKAMSSDDGHAAVVPDAYPDIQEPVGSHERQSDAGGAVPRHKATGVVYDQSVTPALGDEFEGSDPAPSADSREPVYTTGTVVRDTGPVLDVDSLEPVYTLDAVVQDTGPVLDADEAYRVTGQR